MSSVFVSHSSGDDALVSRIVADLRSAGHTVWVDQSDLLPGGAVAGSIQEGIAGSDAFVLLHSHTASSSRWVELEWQAALGRNMDDSAYNLVLVRVDDCKVPLILSSRKWIEMSRGYDGAIQDLLAALGPSEQQRPLVWYFDDSHAALSSFDERHSSAFCVRTFTDVLDLITATGQAARDASLTPDIILLDLHCPRQDADPDVLAETDHRLAEFLQAERELKDYVDAAWHPVGVDIVESVRQIYPPDILPIVMHTQQGLFLLRDELLQELEEMGAGWLLKGRFSPETDRMIIERIVLQSGHALDTEKLRVLIIDDNPRFIDAFVDRQSGHYEIEAIENESEVLRTLSQLQAQQAFPDVFVVDMYYPRATDEDPAGESTWPTRSSTSLPRWNETPQRRAGGLRTSRPHRTETDTPQLQGRRRAGVGVHTERHADARRP